MATLRHGRLSCILMFGVACLGATLAATALGQGAGKKPKSSPSQLKALDAEADRLQQSFLGGLKDLAKEYEDAGQTDRARSMLQEILKLDPENSTAQQKLKAFDEAVFKANEVELDIDASRGWTAANLSVTRGKPVRFSAAGTYKFIVNETLGPDGFPTRDIVQDMAEAPLGALVGVVIPPRQGDRPDQQQQQLTGKTFVIGAGTEYTPTEDGMLFLKLNVPPASKCTGKVKASVSGNIRRAG